MPTKAELQNLAVLRVASLILSNAMLFQEVLSQFDKNIKNLHTVIHSEDIIGEFINQWEYIVKEIDYVPIFEVAKDILLSLSSLPDVAEKLKDLANTAIIISLKRAALRHDLMGRIFHRLLADAKYLGAFYTRIPASTILLKLATDNFDFGINWSNLESIKEFNMIDFACGTGTLLKAALSCLVDKYIINAMSIGEVPNTDMAHQLLIENCIWGFDVLSSAVHIAATALVMHNCNVPIENSMKIYRLPLGVVNGINQLGSIEFIKYRDLLLTSTLFGQIVGSEEAITEEHKKITIPKIHLCAMNPPFTRSVYKNLLFGNIENLEDRRELLDELSSILSDYQINANLTAGLGPVFIALADRFLEVGSVMALVLPKTVLNGSAWLPTRKVFQKYFVSYIIASHEFDNNMFSESSDLSEILLVMQKKSMSDNEIEETEINKTRFVNLSIQPKTSIEALSVANQIQKSVPADLGAISGTCELIIGEKKYGEVVAMELLPYIPHTAIDSSTSTRQSALLPIQKNIAWSLPVSFIQTDLNRIAYFFKKNKIYFPSKGIVGDIETIYLTDIADLGPDGRDIYDGFSISPSQTIYPALWGMDSSTTNQLSIPPNTYLAPLTKALKGRKLRNAQLLWSRSGNLMLPKELWPPTNRVAAVLLPEPALSNVWWPTRCKSSEIEKRVMMEKILALWFNSTLGFFTMLMERQETRGPWIKFPKTWYSDLEILNITRLKKTDIKKAITLWNKIAQSPILPFPQMVNDPIRKEIDDFFSQILNVPDFDEIRKILINEPIFIR